MTLGEIKRKLKHDIPTAGRTQPDPTRIVFVTNQYLSKAGRQSLIAQVSIEVDLFHLERISRILDSPAQYGVRLEFLDIEMSKEEQVALFSSWAEMTLILRTELVKFSDLATQAGVIGHIPTEQVERFREIVHSLVGYPSAFFDVTSPMAQLKPPLRELEEYEAKLRSLVGGDSLFMAAGLIDRLHPPLRELEKYETRLKALVGESPFFSTGSGLVDRLRPPLQALEEYERQLERILEKQSRLLQSGVVEWNESKLSDE